MNRIFIYKLAARALSAFLGIFLCWLDVDGASLKDTESSSHVDTVATQVVVKIYEYTGVKIVQFNLAVLSHYSYMVVS